MLFFETGNKIRTSDLVSVSFSYITCGIRYGVCCKMYMVVPKTFYQTVALLYTFGIIMVMLRVYSELGPVIGHTKQ